MFAAFGSDFEGDCDFGARIVTASGAGTAAAGRASPATPHASEHSAEDVFEVD